MSSNYSLKGYLASFFFDKFGYEGTSELAKEIREAIPGIDLYVPQENGEINDKENNDSSITAKDIYKGDKEKLLNSDILIAYLDGVEIDSGVSAEIGMFAGYMEAIKELQGEYPEKMIIGLYTDMRQAGTGDNHMYKNLFTKGACEHFGIVVKTTEEVINKIQNFNNKIKVKEEEVNVCSENSLKNIVETLSKLIKTQGNLKLSEVKPSSGVIVKQVYNNGGKAFRGNCGQKYNKNSDWKLYNAILIENKER